MADFVVPEILVNVPVRIATKVPIAAKNGAMGFITFEATITQVLPGALLLLSEGAEVLIPMDNVQHIQRVSSIETIAGAAAKMVLAKR